MGASCCAKPTGDSQSHASTPEVHRDSHEHGGHENGGCCGNGHQHGNDSEHDDGHEHGGCCGEDHSDASSVLSVASTCCGSEERCDEKCIYAVTALECGKACEDDPDHEKSPDHPHEQEQGGHKTGSACNIHLQAAFDQNSSYLEQLRCICRSVIDQGAASLDTCCVGNKSSTANAKKNKHAGHKHKKSKATTSGAAFKASGAGGKDRTDPEKMGGVETVGFLVSGMDCTACADKLMRVFGTMMGVSQAQVNFVMGKGEFNIDTSIANADEVIRFASTASGFSLSTIVGGNYRYFLGSTAEGERLASDPPRGVTEVQALDKKTVRLAHEPTIIGARGLFGLVEDRCKGLAQPHGDPQLENSRRRLWDQLTKTLLTSI